MVYKLLKLLVLFVVLLHTVNAQNLKSVKVITSDSAGNPLTNVSVVLISVPDSMILQTSITSITGAVDFFKVKKGQYIISGSAVGFENGFSKAFIVDSTKETETIKLALFPSNKLLSAVTVTSKKPLIENKLDRTVVNVDAFISNAGNTLLDVLGSAPNVDVDLNGTISVKGKSGVVILTDGKQNFLNGVELANYLRSIPASLVDQIEIMTQPSAKYDASGNAALINVKVKKAKHMGFNANLNSSFIKGKYSKILNSVVLNYKNAQWNFFGNISYNHIKNFTHRILTRSVFSGANSDHFLYVQDEHDPVNINDLSFSAGVDYLSSKRWSIGLLYTHKNNSRVNSTKEDGDFMDLDKGKIVSTMNGLNILNNPVKNNGISVNIRNIINKNKELVFDINYELYNFRSHQELSNTSYDDQGNILVGTTPNPLVQTSKRPSDINIFSVKSDYSYTHNNMKFETGVKSSFIQSNNTSNYFVKINDTFKMDVHQSNNYKYQENINAGYVNFHYQYNKWEFQGGLRLEGTISKGIVTNEDRNFYNTYLELFPTLYAGFAANKDNNISMSYGRRIDRPNYMDLNPFLYSIDPYTYNQGNPHLSPYFTNTLQLSYNHKQKLNFGASYSITKNIIDDIQWQNDSTKILLQTRSNLNQLENFDFSVTFNSNFGKWGSLMVSDNLFNNHFSSNVAGHYLDKNVWTNLLNITQQFHFSKGWNTELNVVYRTHLLFSAWNYRGPRYQNSLGFGKEIFKHKGSLKLKINDPFNKDKGWGANDFGNIHTTISYKEDSRRIGISFSYRFQKGEKSSFKKMYSAEENKRIL